MRHPTHRIVTAVAALGLALGAPAVAQDSHPLPAQSEPLLLHSEPLQLHSEPQSLDNGNHNLREVGGLLYRAGFHLTAERPEFGGFSGMELIAGGTWLAAVSDHGTWLLVELHHDDKGTVDGFGRAAMGPLLDLDGAPVEGRDRWDAEEIVLRGDRFLVTFEGQHRIFSYLADGFPPAPRGVPVEVASPEELPRIHHNTGMEAVASLNDGRLLVMTEDFRDDDGSIVGWIGDGDTWGRLTLRPTESFLPTGATVLPDGDVLLLERTWDEATDITQIRVSRIPIGDLVPGAELVSREIARLRPPQTVDNMEAIAVRSGPAGEILIYLVSDDNFNEKQRTLLMQFEMLPVETPPVEMPAQSGAVHMPRPSVAATNRP